jgi:hypothetical protein
LTFNDYSKVARTRDLYEYWTEDNEAKVTINWPEATVKSAVFGNSSPYRHGIINAKGKEWIYTRLVPSIDTPGCATLDANGDIIHFAAAFVCSVTEEWDIGEHRYVYVEMRCIYAEEATDLTQLNIILNRGEYADTPKFDRFLMSTTPPRDEQVTLLNTCDIFGWAATSKKAVVEDDYLVVKNPRYNWMTNLKNVFYDTGFKSWKRKFRAKNSDMVKIRPLLAGRADYASHLGALRRHFRDIITNEGETIKSSKWVKREEELTEAFFVGIILNTDRNSDLNDFFLANTATEK